VELLLIKSGTCAYLMLTFEVTPFRIYPEMCFKTTGTSVLGYTIYAIIGTLLEQAAVVIIVLWGLPRIDVHIPWWGLATIMVIMLAYSYFTYRMGIAVLGRKPVVVPDSLIGCEGKVATPLDPKGYVKVRGELWKAFSESKLEAGDDIVVTGIDGIKLIVAPKEKS